VTGEKSNKKNRYVRILNDTFANGNKNKDGCYNNGITKNKKIFQSRNEI